MARSRIDARTRARLLGLLRRRGRSHRHRLRAHTRGRPSLRVDLRLRHAVRPRDRGRRDCARRPRAAAHRPRARAPPQARVPDGARPPRDLDRHPHRQGPRHRRGDHRGHRRGHPRALATTLHGSGRARAVAFDRAHGPRRRRPDVRVRPRRAAAPAQRRRAAADGRQRDPGCRGATRRPQRRACRCTAGSASGSRHRSRSSGSRACCSCSSSCSRRSPNARSPTRWRASGCATS